MAKTSEKAFNVKFAEALSRKHPSWRNAITVEQTGVFAQAALQPDIIIRHPGGAPLAVETEFEPALGAESDATKRLGLTLAEGGERLEQAVAVRIPAELRHGQQDLERRINAAELAFCVLSGSPGSPLRWPPKGWLRAGIDDLATCIERVALSESLIDRGIKALELGVSQAASILREDCRRGRPFPCANMAALLHQEDSEQTSRMAMAIIANALIFQTSIAGSFGMKPPSAMRNELGHIDMIEIQECWRRILREINYWPIFDLASKLLFEVHPAISPRVLERLTDAATRLANIGMSSLSDLSGRMFQRLIADRKFLATFYTLPSSAALLAELAVARMDVDWTSPKAIQGICIADLACGTGALLGAAYQAVRSRHRRAAGDDARLHRAMMERCLVAADIMPAATHLAAALLSSAHPVVTFRNTRIYTLPYGQQPEGVSPGIAIGSLELIRRDTPQALFGTGEAIAHGTGPSVEARDLAIADDSADLVIMNPPFTNPTNHESATVPVPSFAGFETSDQEQEAMAKRLRKIRTFLESPDGSEKSAGHGNAGLATNFMDLAHAKVKPGGVIALVLPFSFAQGWAWESARRLLYRHYCKLTVVAIASAGSEDRAFSADTGMAEALVLGTKRVDEDELPGPTLFVNLLQRPRSILDGCAVANAIAKIPEDARKGRLRVGDIDQVGTYIRVCGAQGCAGILDPGLAESMLELTSCRLSLARMTDSHNLPVTKLKEVGTRGLIHRDISGWKNRKTKTPRGPFDIGPILGVATYPVLWGHNAELERCMVVAPDREGVPRPNLDAKALQAWESTASRLHFNLDFQVNSQSLAACLTAERTIGGTAWPNFRTNSEWEEAIVLWANGTLGLASFWWLGTRQQEGRARLTISRVPELVTIDPRQLGAERLRVARRLFEEFKERPLLAANEAYRDPVRKALDKALLIDLLGLPTTVLKPLDLFRRQWCAEPSVHGGKTTKPPTPSQVP